MNKNISNQYDEIGADYISGQSEFFADKDDATIKFIESSVGDFNGKIVLDVGCGNGRDIISYSSLGANKVYGIDTSEYMIGEASKNVGDTTNLTVASIEKTGFSDSLFDVATSRYAMHYLPQLDEAFREIHRILKENGKLAFIVPHPFRDLIMQDEKKYGYREIVGAKLFDSGVTVKYPTHTLSDYLSETFFKYFVLERFIEDPQSDEYEKDEFATPGFIGISATKRNL